MFLSRANKVRLHYFDADTPSVEGLLVSRRHNEYAIAIPRLLPAEGEQVALASQRVLVPREAVAMLEVLA